MTLVSTVQVANERKNWKRFGEALKAVEGESVTARALEDVPFERVRQQKQTQEEKKAANIQQALQGSDKQAIVGRYAMSAVQNSFKWGNSY